MNQEQTLNEIKNLVEGAELSLKDAKRLLVGLVGHEASSELVSKAQARGGTRSEGSSQIIEGVFDGQHMVGPDGKQYSVPANYASKSKLVEGDLMKLTIDRFGNFLYKQIGPMERARLKGKLVKDESSSEWRVVADGKSYKVLLASVTYFKGEEGDQVTILVPKDKSSTWAAVENIVHNPISDEEDQDTAEPENANIMSEPLPTEPPALSETTTVADSRADDYENIAVSERESGSDGFGGTDSRDLQNDAGGEDSNLSGGEVPHFAGNVPAYSPEPSDSDISEHRPYEEARDDVEDIESVPADKTEDDAYPEGMGLGGGLGGNLSGFGNQDDAPAENNVPRTVGYDEINFDDDKDEFQRI